MHKQENEKYCSLNCLYSFSNYVRTKLSIKFFEMYKRYGCDPTSYVKKRDFRARRDTRGEGTRAWDLAIFNHCSRFPSITTTSNQSHQWSMCRLHLTFTSSYLSSFSLSLKSISRFSFTISHVLNEVYLEFVLSENWIRKNPSSPNFLGTKWRAAFVYPGW